jgi:hypothetical protein
MKWETLNHRKLDMLFSIGVIFVFLLEILLLFSPRHEENIRITYLAPLIVAMMAYVVVRIGLQRMPVAWLPPLFAVWHLLTRIMNGDIYLAESHAYVYMILFSCCVLFPAPFLTNGENRGKLLKAVALVYSIAFSVIAWTADIAALTGIPWVNPMDAVNILGINEIYTNPYRLNVLGIHPNFSAVFFYTSLALILYLFVLTKKLWTRILYVVMAIGLCMAIYLTGSISAIIVTGLMFGLALIAFLFGRKRNSKRWMLIAVLVVLLVALIVVFAYPLIIQWSENMYHQVQKNEAVNSPSLVDNQEGTEVFAQERLQIDNMIQTMKDRFVMYSSAFLSVADRPLTLLIGELWQDAMDRSAKVIHYEYQNHLHNSYLQTLVVGGGISFLITIVLTVLLAVYGARLFYGKAVPLHLKLLVLAPVGLIVHSMTEAILFIDTRLPNMLFFLLAGMIVAYASELTPKREKANEALPAKTPAEAA